MCSYLYRIPQGDISLDELRVAMLSALSEKELNSAVEVYRHAYGDTISEAEAFEEMCCDALGKINIFAGTEHDSANYGKVQESFRKHTAETANKGRAPPKKGGEMYSLEPYSNQQIENWKNSKRIIVYKNEDQLLNFVRKAVNQKDYNGKMYFGIVSDNLVARVEAEAGVKLKKLNVTLRAGNVRKVFKDHGSETTEKLRGQRAIEIEDFALIPDVIETPDSIEISEYKGKTALNFAKGINNSRVSVYAVDSGSSLELFVQTMYAGKKKESIADISDATKASEKTSETSAGTAPNTNIPNTSKNVNEKFSHEPERLNELRRQNETMLAQATNEDAANENERGLIKDYKRQYDKVSGIAEKLNTARQEVLTAERSGGGNTTAKKKIKKTPDNLSGVWQGKKASNPRPTVLETAALPAELFPYKIGGPSGTRTPDRPVMSRLL